MIQVRPRSASRRLFDDLACVFAPGGKARGAALAKARAQQRELRERAHPRRRLELRQRGLQACNFLALDELERHESGVLQDTAGDAGLVRNQQVVVEHERAAASLMRCSAMRSKLSTGNNSADSRVRHWKSDAVSITIDKPACEACRS